MNQVEQHEYETQQSLEARIKKLEDMMASPEEIISGEDTYIRCTCDTYFRITGEQGWFIRLPSKLCPIHKGFRTRMGRADETTLPRHI